MHDYSSKIVPPAGSDYLSEMLRGLRLDGVEYCRCEMTAPWSLSFDASDAAKFYFVAGAPCWLRMPDGTWRALKNGDALLLPRGLAHVLASAPGPAAASDCAVKRRCGDIVDMQGGGGGDHTLLFGGRMAFNVDGDHPLLRLMPDTMQLCDLSGNEPGLLPLLEAMARETALDRVGAGGILARLADVIAATIIRGWVESGCGDTKGWVAAARCPQIGRVLAAIHADPATDWTVDKLAALIGQSRSGFAERFADVVGETPARYVTQIRMHQARRWLAQDKLRIAVVAQRLGYDSEAAFSRAFKRVTGSAPSRIRAGA